MHVRSYQVSDHQDISQLMALLGYHRKGQDVSVSIGRFLERPDNKIFVAEHQGLLIGYIALALHELLVTPFKRCRIENLAVHSDYRRQGVASALMKKTLDYAVKKGVSILDVTSSLKREREGAFDFYKSFGFSNEGNEYRQYFRKKLEC